MDGTGVTDRCRTVVVKREYKHAKTMLRRVGGRREEHGKLEHKPGWSWLQVQIFVVVANIQTRPSKTEVEKGYMPTTVKHESVSPKTQVKVFPKGAKSITKEREMYRTVLYLFSDRIKQIMLNLGPIYLQEVHIVP